jgi:hypothetical protein
MGFDIYGLNPKNKEGEYFRNNVWWWRGIAVMVEQTCCDILTEEQLEGLHMNNGIKYNEELASMVVEKLEELMDEDWKFNAKVSVIKQELGQNYPFDKKNLHEFMEFCKSSGGFEIC